MTQETRDRGEPMVNIMTDWEINTLVKRKWRRTEEHFKDTMNSLIFCEFPFTKS